MEFVLEHGAGKEKHQAIKDILAQNGASEDGALSQNIFSDFKDMLEVAYGQLIVTSFEGVADVLGILRKNGVKIALNTGYNSHTANQLLHKMGWEQTVHYDILVTADDVKLGRPNPDMIQKAMDAFGISDASKVLKAGDSIIDIEEGKNAGCGLTIGVTTGAHTREQLNSARPDFVLDSLMALTDLLGLK